MVVSVGRWVGPKRRGLHQEEWPQRGVLTEERLETGSKARDLLERIADVNIGVFLQIDLLWSMLWSEVNFDDSSGL